MHLMSVPGFESLSKLLKYMVANVPVGPKIQRDRDINISEYPVYLGVNKNSSEVTALFHQSKRTTTTFFDKISGEVIKLNKYVSNRNDNSDETCLLESDIWRTDAAEELSQS